MNTLTSSADDNRYKYICSDCIDYLQTLPDKSISLVITSPPYNIGLKYNSFNDKKISRKEYLDWIFKIFSLIKVKLKDDGQIFLNIGYTNSDPWIPMEVSLQLRDLFTLQNNITWVKSISIGNNAEDTYGNFKPINSKRYICPTNESIFHFTKKGNVNIDRLSIGVPYKFKCNLQERNKKKNKTGIIKKDKRCKGNSWFIKYKNINSRKKRGNHPATYPEELVIQCIKVSGIREGIVFDPFVGSGTTIRAVKNLNNEDSFNLTGVGTDIDQAYIDYCNEQLN